MVFVLYQPESYLLVDSAEEDDSNRVDDRWEELDVHGDLATVCHVVSFIVVNAPRSLSNLYYEDTCNEEE